MRREVQAVVLLLLGTATIRIGADGSYLYYVKPLLRWPLVAAGVLVAAVGLHSLLYALRSPDEVQEGAHEPGEAGAHTPRVAWLLTLPVFAILLIAPGPLGAYAAARDSGTVARPAGDSDFPPLPPGDPVALPTTEYAVRAIWESGRSLLDRRLELTGFVTARPGGGWYLTRIQLACCAADGQATKVEARGASDLPEDTWVRVIGRYAPATDPDPEQALAAFDVESVRKIPAPSDPYE